MATAWNKLKTLLRGQTRIGMEQVINANDMLLLDQQLHETEQALREARRQQARLMAEKTLQQKREQQLGKQIAYFEDCARQALAQQQQALALETGERIADLEEQQQQLQQQLLQLNRQDQDFRHQVQQAADQLRQLRQQQALARSNEVLFGANRRAGQAAGLGLAEQLQDSQQTLQQIQQRQEESRLIWHSEQQLAGATGDDSLEQKLAEAGIGHGRSQRAQAIITRLKGDNSTGIEHGKT